MQKDDKSVPSDLRQKAEILLKKKPSKTGSRLHETEKMKLIHELEVHQIELELQNEELMLARSAAMIDTVKYTELYDFAPSGFFTLSKEGEITELNLFGSQMLGKERRQLINNRFGVFISDDTKPILNLFFEKVFKSKAKESCEVTLSKNSDSPIYVHLSGIVIENGEQCLVTMIDITDRKRVEEELRAKEEKFRRLVEHISDAVIMDDKEGNIIFYNDCFLKTFGFQPGEFTHISIDDYVAPEWIAELRNRHNRRVRGEKVFDRFEYEGIRKDGQRLWIEVNVVPIKDKAGTIIGTQSALRDITERKKIEEALIESEEKYRNIVNWAPVGIYRSTVDGKFLSVNQQLTEILGYESIDDLQCRNIETDIYLFPSERQSAIARFESSGYVFNFEMKWKKKDGTPIWISLSTHAIKDQAGIIQYFEGFVSEITERKRIEQALQENEERLRDVIFSMADWVWEMDAKGVYVYSSQKGFDLFGKANDDIIGKTPFDFMPPDEVERFATIFSEIMANKKSIKDLENWNITKNGERICLLTNGLPILDKEGNLKGYRGVDKDITDRKQAEEKILRQLEELHRWQEVTLGREDRNRQLKYEVNELLVRLGETIRYPSQEKNYPNHLTKYNNNE